MINFKLAETTLRSSYGLRAAYKKSIKHCTQHKEESYQWMRIDKLFATKEQCLKGLKDRQKQQKFMQNPNQIKKQVLLMKL